MSRRAAAGHSIIALGSAVALVALVFSTLRASVSDAQPKIEYTDIGIEHQEALLVRIRVTVNRAPGLFEFSHDAREPITIHLPSDWMQREVRNVPLSSVSSAQTDTNYTSYTLPPNAQISFVAPTDVGPLSVHNASSAPLTIRYEKANLESGQIDRDVTIVQKGSALLE